MKKKLLTLIIALVCIFSFNVFAESSEKLIVKSGDGTKLGDEVCIGDQCFYLLENDGKKATLLSKYNLYNGWVYNEIDFLKETDNYQERDTKCYNPRSGNGCWIDFYDKTGLTVEDIIRYYDNNYQQYVGDDGKTYFKTFYYTYLDNKEFKQSSEAIGLHGGDENNRTPEYPEVGVFFKYNSNLNPYIAQDGEDGADTYFVKDGDKYATYLQDFNFEDDFIYYDGGNYNIFQNNPSGRSYKVLTGYQKFLDGLGLKIKDISIMSLSDLNNISKSATGSELPLDEWVEGRDFGEYYSGHDQYYFYGSLKEELGNDYSWLWGTTYWLRTYDYRPNDSYNLPSFLFVESIGNICSDGGCTGMVGAGVRPVIEVDAKDIVKPKQEIIVNPETGGVIAIAVLGLLGIGLFSFKLNKRNN